MAVAIDYDALKEAISAQFAEALATKDEYSSLKVKVSEERVFGTRGTYSKDTAYIALKWGESSVNFGVSALECTMRVMSEQGTFERARDLLSDYVALYNLKSLGSAAFNQIYSSPTVTNVFAEVGAGIRSVLEVSCVFLIGSATLDDISSITFSDGESSEEVSVLSFSESYQNMLSPQPQPDGGGFAESVAKYGVYTFSISSYLDTGLLCSALRKQVWQDGNEKATYSFTITLKSGETVTKDFLLAYFNGNQKIGEALTYSATFTL